MNRGQATVEMALGALVFVTVLLFGIAFAEWSFVSLKVHEAASSALWDTTARTQHRKPNDYAPRAEAIAEAGPLAIQRYAGFDGRTRLQGQNGLSQVLTRASALEVQCRPNRLLDTSAARLAPFPGGEGGMVCSSSAQLSLLLDVFPTRFADQPADGFFTEKHVTRDRITVCGLGRGECDRKGYGLLLDTWALTGRDEARDCRLRRCANEGFHDLVEQLYRRALAQGAGRESARAFAQALVQRGVPGEPTHTFRFSFVDSKGDPTFKGGDQDPANWMTNVRTGSRNVRYHDRGDRFLGQRGPR